MIRKNVLLVVCCSGVIGLGLVGLAQKSAQSPVPPKVSEAPAGFRTPTLSAHPGSKSVSNGIPEPPHDTFALDQANFESREGNDTVSALFTTLRFAPIAIKALEPVDPARSRKCERGTSIPVAIL